MCGRPKRNPKIDEQLEKQEKTATAAKEQATIDLEATREKQLEAERKAKADAATLKKEQEQAALRQAELDRQAAAEKKQAAAEKKQSDAVAMAEKMGELTASGTRAAEQTYSTAQMRRRSLRKGRGRRSLLAGSGGGAGFFSRFT